MSLVTVKNCQSFQGQTSGSLKFVNVISLFIIKEILMKLSTNVFDASGKNSKVVKVSWFVVTLFMGTLSTRYVFND